MMPFTHASHRPGAGAADERQSPASAKLILAGGFAIVFALWLVWGYQLTRSLRDVEGRVSGIHEVYLRGEQTLSDVRTNVLLGSIYLRDAIIDSASTRREAYQQELGRLRAGADTALTAYLPEVPSEERPRWLELQTELAEFWASRNIPFEVGSLTPDRASALLRSSIVPRRETALQIIDELSNLQAGANDRRLEEAAALYQNVRIRLLSMGAVTLLAALTVAVVASRHVNRLQREIDRQRSAEQRTLRELERLSARLVDAQEQERRNLARELHDEVGQALTAVKMDIGIALRSDNQARVRGALEEARDLAETTLRGVRDLSQLLHPSMLDDFGLPTTLETYLRKFTQRTGIRAHLSGAIDQRLGAAIEVCVYRIVQEALNNVAQHSGATTCTVLLTVGTGQLHLIVEDNGRGMTAISHGAAPGLGLIGMRERAQSLGGVFRVSPRQPLGTRIEVTLPLDVRPSPSDAEPAFHPEAL
jgi:signal transduction histidine kinase